jgi:DNA-binding PadR family transcriptional regulator
MYNESWGGPRESRDPRGRGRGHGPGRGRRGGPFPDGPPFEFAMRGGPFGPPKFGGRGPRVRRGDVRAAILDLLAEGQPWNGYQIIQEIGSRTEGVWRPSAGSVYPALQLLEDEGLISTQRDEATDGRTRMFTLTDQGRAYVEEHAAELRASWDAVTGSVDASEVQLRDTVKQVIVAVTQVAQAGSPAQIQQAGKVLADTRRALYRILAADGGDAGEDTQG